MKTPNYFITFLSSATHVGYKVISQSIQYKLTENKAAKEAAIDATAVNKIDREGEKAQLQFLPSKVRHI